MTAPGKGVLEMARTVHAPPETVWNVLTTPALMRRWMFVTPRFPGEDRIAQGTRLDWLDDDGAAYLTGIVATCEPGQSLVVELHDRAWPRPARPGEVTWAFLLRPAPRGNTELVHRFGDLSIDPQGAAWRDAYEAADEPGRIAAICERIVR